MKSIKNNTRARIDLHFDGPGSEPLGVGGEGNPDTVEVSDETAEKIGKLAASSKIVGSYFVPGANGKPALEVIDLDAPAKEEPKEEPKEGAKTEGTGGEGKP